MATVSCWRVCNATCCSLDFSFSDTSTTEIYTLSLHDALPISDDVATLEIAWEKLKVSVPIRVNTTEEVLTNISSLDRKSTRLNSSHGYISYAVFCLKKKSKTGRCVRGVTIITGS